MNGGRLLYWLKDFWSEFRKVKSGLVGLAFLLLFLLSVVLEPLLIPFPETNKRWSDITYWDENPRSAPPFWTNWFTGKKSAVTERIRSFKAEERQSDGVTLRNLTFPYEDSFEYPPYDLIVHFSGKGSVPFLVALQRPDGEALELIRAQADLTEGEDFHVSVDKEARDAVMEYVRSKESEEAMSRLNRSALVPTEMIFAEAGPGMAAKPIALKGNYRVIVTLMILPDAEVKDPFLVVSGRVSGILGTDSSKRDIWSGIVAGVKWALLIGLLTAFVSVSVGVVYGIMSAYLGGWKDSLMQRIFELFISVPLLPILIVMSAVFKPSIWTIIVMMCAFFWVRPVKTVRSMALQIKEETYIEASRALGAGSGRIIFRHMVPLLIPYAFAVMALDVPSAVVYEATVSLIGLGDATIVTWGQILRGALTGGAVLGGLWWWVVPPGIMIALMGMTFAFVGFAMDKILHPKLRTR